MSTSFRYSSNARRLPTRRSSERCVPKSCLLLLRCSVRWLAPKKKEGPKSLDEVDPELMKTFDKLGIPLHERAQLSGMAVDAVMDSVSVKTTFKETLAEKGIIFCSFSEAVQHHPDLVQKYLGSVVSYRDNFFAALNSAVFSDGSFVYIPKGVRCPMELSTCTVQ